MERTEIEEKVINIVGQVCIFSSPDDPITEKRQPAKQPRIRLHRQDRNSREVERSVCIS